MLLIFCDLLWFVAVFFGLTVAVSRWVTLNEPVARLALGLGAGVIAVYLTVFGLYVANAPLPWMAALPALAWASVLVRPASLRSLAREPAVRATLTGWLILALWCLGWQALVTSYSGGGWAGDWHEHFERAHFFAQHWRLDYRFIGVNALPARPPLANLVTGGLLALAGPGVAPFQVFATLLNTLVYFPLAALVRRYGGGRRAIATLTLLLMLSPLLVENATFPWTKLVAALFVLLAILFLPRPDEPRGRPGLALVALAAGVLAHYSTVPWVIALGVTWLWTTRRSWGEPALRREVAWGGAAAALLLATWAVWGSRHYGIALMLRAPSDANNFPHVGLSEHAAIAAANLWHTFVPDWDSPLLAVFLQQPDWYSRLRDLAFTLSEHNLPLAFGLGNLVVLLWLLAKNYAGRAAAPWRITVPLVVAAGVVVHAAPVDIGVAHICLQPLVLLGLLWVALASDGLPRWLRIAWVAGLTADFLLGIALQFALQSLALPRWVHPEMTDPELLQRFTSAGVMNYRGKLRIGQPFLGDYLADQRGLVVLVLGALLGLAIVRWRAAQREPAA